MIRATVAAPSIDRVLAAVPPALELATDGLVARTAQRVAADAARRSPGERVTNGIVLEQHGHGYTRSARVYLAGVAIPVATGSKPHRIEPVERRALAFPSGGFASGVDHPGAQPNTFFGDSIAGVMSGLDAELRKAGADIAGAIAEEARK